jgi:hypothetical protein
VVKESELAKSVKEHLGFLGYSIGAESLENFGAKGVSGTNLWIRVQSPDLVLMLVWYSGWIKDSSGSIEFQQAIQKANILSLFGKWFLDKKDKEDILVIGVTIVGYERRIFGLALESFLADIHRCLPEILKFQEKEA